MTMLEAIGRLDQLKPNAFSREQKALWLSALEELIHRFRGNYREQAPPFTPFTPDTDPDTRLLLPAAYENCYLYWLEAQLHYANEDISRYNAAITLFRSAFDDYCRHYHRTHTPKDPGDFQFRR